MEENKNALDLEQINTVSGGEGSDAIANRPRPRPGDPPTSPIPGPPPWPDPFSHPDPTAPSNPEKIY